MVLCIPPYVIFCLYMKRYVPGALVIIEMWELKLRTSTRLVEVRKDCSIRRRKHDGIIEIGK